MKACNRGPKPGLPAFTLVEVLVALTLTTLLVTLTGRMAINALTARQNAGQVLAGLQRDAMLTDRLAEDIAALLWNMPEESTPIQVFGTPHQVLQLHVLSPSPQSEGALHLAKRPATVRYRLIRSKQRTATVVREFMDRTDRGALPIRETIARNIKRFDVEVLAGHTWGKGYPVSYDPKEIPRALRVSWTWSDSSHPQVRTFLVTHEEFNK